MKVTARRIAGTNMMGAVKLRRRKTISLAEIIMSRHMETAGYDFPPASMVFLMMDEREAAEHTFKAAELITVLHQMKIQETPYVLYNQIINQLLNQIRYELDMAGAMGGKEAVRLEKIFEQILQRKGQRFDEELHQIRERLTGRQEMLEKRLYPRTGHIQTVRKLPDYREIWRQSVAYCRPAREFLHFLEEMEDGQQKAVLRLLGEKKEILFPRLYEMKQSQWVLFSRKITGRLERIGRIEQEKLLWNEKRIENEIEDRDFPEQSLEGNKVQELIRGMDLAQWDVLVEIMYREYKENVVSQSFIKKLNESTFEEYEKQAAEKRLEYKTRLFAALDEIEKDKAELFLRRSIEAARAVYRMQALYVLDKFTVLENEWTEEQKRSGFIEVTGDESGKVVGSMDESVWDILVGIMYEDQKKELVSRRLVSEFSADTSRITLKSLEQMLCLLDETQWQRFSDAVYQASGKRDPLLLASRNERMELMRRGKEAGRAEGEDSVQVLQGFIELVNRQLTEKLYPGEILKSGRMQQPERMQESEGTQQPKELPYSEELRYIERMEQAGEGFHDTENGFSQASEKAEAAQLTEIIGYMDAKEWDALVETMYENQKGELVSRRFVSGISEKTFEEYKKQEIFKRLEQKNVLLSILNQVSQKFPETEKQMEEIPQPEQMRQRKSKQNYRKEEAGNIGETRKEDRVYALNGFIELVNRQLTEGLSYSEKLQHMDRNQQAETGSSGMERASVKTSAAADTAQLTEIIGYMDAKEWDTLVETMYENQRGELVSRRFVSGLSEKTFEEYKEQELFKRLEQKNVLLSILNQVSQKFPETVRQMEEIQQPEQIHQSEQIQRLGKIQQPEPEQNRRRRETEKAGEEVRTYGLQEFKELVYQKLYTEGLQEPEKTQYTRKIQHIERMGHTKEMHQTETLYEKQPVKLVSRRFVSGLSEKIFEEISKMLEQNRSERKAEYKRTDRIRTEERLTDIQEETYQTVLMSHKKDTREEEQEMVQEFTYPPLHMVITRSIPASPGLSPLQPMAPDIVKTAGSQWEDAKEGGETDIRFLSSKPSFTTAAKEYSEQMQKLSDRLEEQMEQLEELKRGQAMLVKRTDTEQMTARILGKLQSQLRLEKLRRGL